MESRFRDARLRLVPLWAAAFLRSLGENAVRVHAFLVLVPSTFGGNVVATLFLWLCLLALPAFVLAPLAGWLAGSRQRRIVMIACLAAGMAAVAFCGFQNEPRLWVFCLGVLAVEGVFFGAARQALVPIPAHEARLSLNRVQGVLTVAVAGGALAGIGIGLEYAPSPGALGLPAAVFVGLISYAGAILMLLLARFRGEADTALDAGMMRPFVESLREIFQTPNVRNTLLALGAWLGLFLLSLPERGWVMSATAVENFGVAFVVGVVIGGLHFHPYRVLGLVPFLATAFLILVAPIFGGWGVSAWGAGIVLGAMLVPLLTVFQASLYPRSWGHGSAILFAWFGMIAVAFAMLLQAYRHDPTGEQLREAVLPVRLGLAAALAVFLWVVFLRPALELIVEVILWPLHRLKQKGPGFAEVPWKGPCLVISNHAAMLDPIWISKYLPLPITPMMTSKFYDLPVISWLMRRVVGTIRVPDVLVRREAPEIQEAVAALDRGECVVIFPEGWLRRKDETPLRRFGRGAWQILKARPDTPVFAFWIEGGWGSFFSWRGGALMKGKPFDIWRTISMAGIGRRQVDGATLESHLATRALLMQWVLEARALLGLPPIEKISIPTEGDEDHEEKGERSARRRE